MERPASRLVTTNILELKDELEEVMQYLYVHIVILIWRRMISNDVH